MVKVAADGQLFWDFDSLDLVKETVNAYRRWVVLTNLRKSAHVRNMRNLKKHGSAAYLESCISWDLFSSMDNAAFMTMQDLKKLLTSDEFLKFYDEVN